MKKDVGVVQFYLEERCMYLIQWNGPDLMTRLPCYVDIISCHVHTPTHFLSLSLMGFRSDVDRVGVIVSDK